MDQLFILGSGGPVATKHRFGTSHAVQLGDEYLLFDCGPAATYRLAKLEIPITSIDHLFFTHHHIDHDVDYPCFLLSRWDQCVGRENELNVYGPAPTTTITERLIGEEGAFAYDWKARVNHPLSHRAYQLRGGILAGLVPAVLAVVVFRLAGPISNPRNAQLIYAASLLLSVVIATFVVAGPYSLFEYLFTQYAH